MISPTSQAIFDAILVHIVNLVSADGKWQQLQQQMCDSLNRKKDDRTVGILETYSEANVVFVQASATFIRCICWCPPSSPFPHFASPIAT